MSIGKKLKILNYILVFSVALLILTILFTSFNQTNLNSSYETRFGSYLLADELRQSSDDLTRLARTYVTTKGESKYEEMYWKILDVRNGKKPRLDGKTIPLKALMKDLGFTDLEFQKLKEAEANSNNLVTTETIAMNAVKGLYNDGTGKYSKKGPKDIKYATEIMFNDKYHQDKKIILDPINEFDKILNERTKNTTVKFKTRGNNLLLVIGGLSVAIAVLIMLTISNIRKILIQLSTELEQSANSTRGFSNKLVKASDRSLQLTSSQASAIQETVTTLDEITAMMKRSVQSAKTSEEKTEDSYKVIREGVDSVDEVIKAMNDINTSNENIMKDISESNTKISGIAQVITEIASKTSVINDIVFQTKLLSFNASVEAARAGENGKGFAVVAEEVGSLAQMSGNAASEISDMLDESIKSVEEIVEEMNNKITDLVSMGESKVKKGISVAQDCKNVFDKVVVNFDEVKVMMNEISNATQEQEVGVKNIADAMNEIDSGTNETAETANETKVFADDMMKQSDELKDLVDSLQKEIHGETSIENLKISA
ncbi:hypothetical protein A9Q84_16715 [Halobacteriovorax marinus]|uniref:Methyl-accepting transducer domain-containing protein n=1 Tax=Halobacteriovorax marinus TaxID=97084 RepID=A0A1Y5F4Z6_9BACT|nr:hypothetical protein A9Q84_16715 [Halobacteriovorax marinus]